MVGLLKARTAEPTEMDLSKHDDFLPKMAILMRKLRL
jgi:hypothetical protein